MTQGDIVKYSNPVDNDEALLRFVLLNDAIADGRAHISLIGDDTISPIETVELSEIQVFESCAS